jgi:hypothetical protein
MVRQAMRDMGKHLWSGLLLLILVALIGIGIWTWLHFDHKALIDGFLGGLLGSLLVLLTAYVAWKQLGKVAQTASADFMLRMRDGFFREETRILVHLIDNGWLKFVDKTENGSSIEYPFFKVDDREIEAAGLHEEIRERLLKRRTYSVYDMDDLILGHFEDLGTLWEAGVLNIDTIYQMFSWYMEITWENSEIHRYIQTQKQESAELYSKFERLHNACGGRKESQVRNRAL